MSKLNEELKELRILGIKRIDSIEVFKILRGFDNVNLNKFLLVMGKGVRSHTVLNCSGRNMNGSWNVQVCEQGL